MKLSVFTTITDPFLRSDNYKDAIACYKELADEVTIIDGGRQNQNSIDLRYLKSSWPDEFDWPFIGQQFQRGYQACTGDWVIHADLDFIFHQKDFEAIRKACENNLESPALSFYKYQFIQPDRYNLKSRLVIAVNKGKYGDRIRFDSGGDLCQPSLDGVYISPNDVPEARVPFYNYEKLLKTKEQVMDDVGRMERAYKRHFGKTQYGSNGTDEDAYTLWIKAQVGKFNKPQKQIQLNEHPKYIQETIKNLKPENFGYNAYGNLVENNYQKVDRQSS